MTYFNLGIVLEQNSRRPEAVDAYRKSVSLYETLAAEVPTAPVYREELTGSLHNLAGTLADTGGKTEAQKTYRRAITIFEGLVAEFPQNRYYQSQFGRVLNGLAVLLRDRNDLDEAAEFLKRAIHHQQIARELNRKKLEYSQYLMSHYIDLAEVRLHQGDHAAAAKIAEQLTLLLPDRPEGNYNAACLFSRCVPLAEKDTRLAESQRRNLAESYGNTAMDRLRTAVNKGYKDVAHLKEDKDLDPMRSRADFQKLLQELEKETSLAPAQPR
jgi:tetratricopeptide (TPR) repeat protein